MKEIENNLYRYRYLISIVCGSLFAIPYFIPELWILSWFVLIPFFMFTFTYAKSEYMMKRELYRCFFYFFYTYILLDFIWFLKIYPLNLDDVSQSAELLIAIGGWLAISFLIIMPLMLVAFSLKTLRKIDIRLFPFIMAFAWVIAEWLQTWLLSGLPWSTVAVSQYQNLYGIQSISIFGSNFVVFLVVLVNAVIALAVLSKFWVKVKKIQLIVVSMIAMITLNYAFGFYKIRNFEEPENMVNVTVVQGNFSSTEKWSSSVNDILDTYFELTDEALEDAPDNGYPHYVLWPETAIPFVIEEGSDIYEELEAYAYENDIHLIVGAFTQQGETEYNSLVAFSEDLEGNNVYSKQHLVPFGEYLPMRDFLTAFLPSLANINMMSEDLGVGEGSSIIEIDEAKIGGLICFDSIFPNIARQSVLDGANILFISTNDSWYRDSAALDQHNAQAVLRAIENNRYVVRCGNTGISSFISPTGEVIEQSEINEQTTLTATVGLVEETTFYTEHGNVLALFSIVSLGTLFIFRKNKRFTSLTN